MTQTHTTSAIYAVPAVAGVCIDGWAFDCSCGDHQSYSFRQMTEDSARRHREFWAQQATKRSRRAAAR